jgi:ankyrin repeat protein
MSFRFLLAQLYFDSLQDKTSPREMKVALMELQKQPNRQTTEDKKLDALSQAYDGAMERIDGQRQGFRLLAKRVLSWIICAKRPLRDLELQHALAVKTGDNELDKDNLREVEDLVSVCAGLVTIDEGSGIIRLVHYTTQEYFERKLQDWFPSAESDIAIICLTYLSFQTFESGIAQTDKAFEDRLQDNAFYDYAARNWAYHARSVSICQSIVHFLQRHTLVQASCQALFVGNTFRCYDGYSQRFRNKMTGLHLIAWLGPSEASKAIVQLLVEKGANVEARDRYAATPLLLAARKGYHVIVQLLLENGANIEARDISDRTSLSLAAGNGDNVIILLLLKKGANIETRDHYGETPLSLATGNRHATTVLLLLKRGADIDARDSSDRTPLFRAAGEGYDVIVQLLLEKGANIEAKNDGGWTPLSLAATCRRKATVQLLLEKGANIEAETDYGETALSLAARNGHEAIVQLLLEKGANIDAETDYGETALSLAARNGHEATVQLLLGKGAIYRADMMGCSMASERCVVKRMN